MNLISGYVNYLPVSLNSNYIAFTLTENSACFHRIPFKTAYLFEGFYQRNCSWKYYKMTSNSMRLLDERHVATKVDLMSWSNKMDLLALSNIRGKRLWYEKLWSHQIHLKYLFSLCLRWSCSSSTFMAKSLALSTHRRSRSAECGMATWWESDCHSIQHT